MNDCYEYDDDQPIEFAIRDALWDLQSELGFFPIHDDLRRMAAERGEPDPRIPADRLGLVPLVGSDAGWVYFARAARSELVKIGYSTNPWARLSSLQTGSPHELCLEDAFIGTMDDEQCVHAAVAHRHARGEWFMLAPVAVARLVRAGWRGEIDLLAADIKRAIANERHESVERGMRAAW